MGAVKGISMTTDAKPLVLVADDEPGMLALVSRHLTRLGYRVLEASDGDQTLALARAELPDLVVLDVMMPGPGGWEVCKKIREDVSLAHTAVVIVTGIGETLNDMTSPLYGADEFLDKPFELAALDAKIASALAKRGRLGAGLPGLARTAPRRAKPAPKKPAKVVVAKKKSAKPAVAKKKPTKLAAVKKKPAKLAVAKKKPAKPAIAKKKPAARKPAPKATKPTGARKRGR